MEETKEIFDSMPEWSLVSLNTLLVAYTQKAALEQAKSLFDSMPEKDVVSWTTLLVAYSQDMKVEVVKQIFDSLPERNLPLWNTMLAAYAQNGKVHACQKLFDMMPVRDVISWTAMVTAFAHSGLGDEALIKFLELNMNGYHPNGVTFRSVLCACYYKGSVMLLHASVGVWNPGGFVTWLIYSGEAGRWRMPRSCGEYSWRRASLMLMFISRTAEQALRLDSKAGATYVVLCIEGVLLV